MRAGPRQFHDGGVWPVSKSVPRGRCAPTFVESPLAPDVALIGHMKIAAEKALRWFEKFGVALLAAHSNACCACGWVNLSGRICPYRAPSSALLYLDAEFRILLHELHYPPIPYGRRHP